MRASIVKSRPARRTVALIVLALMTAENGCYVYVPTTAVQPSAGARYEFAINDQGRVGLADQLGPGVTTIEGTLVDENADAYVVSVAKIETIASGPSHWSGEKLTVKQGYVTAVRERQLSKPRTVLAAGIAVGAIVAFVVTRALVGGGSDETPGETPPPPGSVIIPHRAP